MKDAYLNMAQENLEISKDFEYSDALLSCDLFIIKIFSMSSCFWHKVCFIGIEFALFVSVIIDDFVKSHEFNYRWLSKKVHIQGVVFFQERGHTCSMPSV